MPAQQQAADVGRHLKNHYDNNQMFRLFVLFSILTLSLTAIGQSKIDSVDETEMRPYQLLDISQNVSLVKLIANPDKYDGKRIQVIGYLNLEFEGTAIYLHKEDYLKSIYENSIWVNFSDKLTRKINPKNWNKKYVLVIGTFSAKNTGHMGMFGGTLDNIVRLDLWDNDKK